MQMVDVATKNRTENWSSSKSGGGNEKGNTGKKETCRRKPK